MRRSVYLAKLGPSDTWVLPTLAKVVKNVTNGEDKIKVSGVYRPGFGMMTYVYAKECAFDSFEFAEFKKRVKANKKITRHMADKIINANYANA